MPWFPLFAHKEASSLSIPPPSANKCPLPETRPHSPPHSNPQLVTQIDHNISMQQTLTESWLPWWRLIPKISFASFFKLGVLSCKRMEDRYLWICMRLATHTVYYVIGIATSFLCCMLQYINDSLGKEVGSVIYIVCILLWITVSMA